MFKQLIILSFLFTSIQASAEGVRGYNQEELAEMEKQKKSPLTEENSFFIYNGHLKTMIVLVKSGFFTPTKQIAYLSKGNCLRVHNQHLGTISIRLLESVNDLAPHWLNVGAVCKKSDCPHGDIFIGYTEDDDGEKVPAVRNLRYSDQDTVDCHHLGRDL